MAELSKGVFERIVMIALGVVICCSVGLLFMVVLFRFLWLFASFIFSLSWVVAGRVLIYIENLPGSSVISRAWVV